MWIILILITLFIVRRILVGMAKSSDAYLEFIVNGINPELHKLIKNQPIKLKYFQSLNSLQQWKKFSSLNYLKKRFEEDKYLHERIKNEIPILMQKEIEPSLEDIFLKLTDNTSEKEENTNESDI